MYVQPDISKPPLSDPKVEETAAQGIEEMARAERVGKWLAEVVDACVRAQAEAGTRRPYVLLNLPGDRGAGSVEVVQGVRGWVRGFTRDRATGRQVSTTVRVCVRTLLAALERDGLIKRVAAGGESGAPGAADGGAP